MRHYLLVPIIFFVLPVVAHAAVLINEVAWMGTSVSANAEWLELANTASIPVDLTGWTITSSSGSPSITLSGTIAGNGYYLLERTSDASVPSAPADQIYTGALSNSGATLTLSDASSLVVDTVVGGTNWANIGGDNTSKETAQRTGGGWETAAATPRAANAGGSDSSISGDSSSTTSSSTTASSSGSSTWSPPPSALIVEAGSDTTALLEVPLTLSARVTTKSGTIDSAADISWNFGDGSSGSGTITEKTYRYPGAYLVEVSASDGPTNGHDEFVVTVEPAQVRIKEVSGVGITISNDSSERLNLSGWRLVAGASSFRFPAGTAIMPEASVLFPASITNLPVAFDTTLAYPDGILATRYALPPSISPATASTTTEQLPALAAGSQRVQTVETAVSTSVSEPAHAETAVIAPATTSQLAAAGAATPAASFRFPAVVKSPWTLGFIGLLVVSVGAFIIL